MPSCYYFGDSTLLVTITPTIITCDCLQLCLFATTNTPTCDWDYNCLWLGINLLTSSDSHNYNTKQFEAFKEFWWGCWNKSKHDIYTQVVKGVGLEYPKIFRTLSLSFRRIWSLIYFNNRSNSPLLRNTITQKYSSYRSSVLYNSFLLIIQ